MWAFSRSLLGRQRFSVKLLLVGVTLGGLLACAYAVMFHDWRVAAPPLDEEARSGWSVYCLPSGFDQSRFSRYRASRSDWVPVKACDVVVARVVSVRGAWAKDDPPSVLLQVEESLRGEVPPGLVQAVWGQVYEDRGFQCGVGESKSLVRSVIDRIPPLPQRRGPFVGQRFIVAGGFTPSRRWFLTHHLDREVFSPTLRAQVIDQLQREAAERSLQVAVEASDRRVGVEDARRDEEVIEAVNQGQAEHVRSLLSAGRRPDARGAWGGLSALHVAAMSGSVDVLRVLLEAGASVEARELGAGDRTALAVAAEQGRLDAVQLLLDHGATPNVQVEDQEPLLVRSASRGRCDIVRALLRAGAHVDGADRGGRTALMAATRHGSPDCVTALLEAGATPNTPDATEPPLTAGATE